MIDNEGRISMIAMFEYTTEEVDLLYSVVEDAVKNKKPIDMFKISSILKTGDFYLYGSGANGLLFTFNGLKWVENNRIYSCLIQPKIRSKNYFPVWVPVISVDDRDHSSSGILSMIKKENRYIKADITWCDRR